MTREALSALVVATNEVLSAIPRGSIEGPINWGDLECFSAEFWADDSGDHGVRVRIAEVEASAIRLRQEVAAHLEKRGYENVEVVMEW